MGGDGRMGGGLPWGWWLRATAAGLEDEQGRVWRSVRQAFWEGELRFPASQFAAEQHELLLRVLASIELRWAGGAERRHDLFAGEMEWWRFYQCWLASLGLLDMSVREGGSVSPLDARLSDEGLSVLRMLQATRDPAWVDLPFPEVLAAVTAARRGLADEARERALKAFETGVGRRRHVFAREHVGRTHLVTLTSISAGPGASMPLRRVVWTQPFTDPLARDDLFGWIALRVDRWDDWGAIAGSKGGNVLTNHIFALYVASEE